MVDSSFGRKNMETLSYHDIYKEKSGICVSPLWSSLFSVGAESLPANIRVFIVSSGEVFFSKWHPLTLCVPYLLCIHLANVYCTLNIYHASEAT